MKNYIDLTQLPEKETEKMVCSLNHNDFKELHKFFEKLGLLYGYPLEQLVDVYSNNLMFDKHKLNKVFKDKDHFIHYLIHIIENRLSALTPLSTTYELSAKVDEIVLSAYSDLSNYIEYVNTLSTDEIPEINENLLALQLNYESLSDVNDKLGIHSEQINEISNSLSNDYVKEDSLSNYLSGYVKIDEVTSILQDHLNDLLTEYQLTAINDTEDFSKLYNVITRLFNFKI